MTLEQKVGQNIEQKIAMAQINPTVGDLVGNGRKIIEYILQAKAAGAAVVVFPEQAVTGYPANDLLLHEDFVKDVAYVNEQISKYTDGITAIVGTIESAEQGANGKSLYSTALVMKDGKIIGRQAKTLLPTYDVFHELRYFTPAKTVEPIEINGVKYGIQLCEDMWDKDYERKITKELADKGAQIIINISASPYHIHKKKARYDMIKEHAAQNKVPFIYLNAVGAQDELIFDGGSMVANPDGTLMHQLPQFEENLSIVDFSKPKKTTLELLVKEEEVFRGLTLGLRDYIKKNNLRKAVLGLSGGIDSALTAVIAAEAIGPENVLGLALPSQFNTSHSYEDAKNLAERLGMKFDVIPIKGMYDAAIKELQRTFEGKPFDVTEENIQARLRMMVLMAYTNKHGYTLLSTGDKSETALGYCTLYGDMSGGISVISDLTKPEVYRLARWYNNMRGQEIIPERTLTKKPSPELKPSQVAPFNYERISPLLELLTNRVPIQKLKEMGYTTDEIREAYRKFRNSEFKRWQAPIALKCKPVSFGHGRIYPVTNRYVPLDLVDDIISKREETKEETREKQEVKIVS